MRWSAASTRAGRALVAAVALGLFSVPGASSADGWHGRGWLGVVMASSGDGAAGVKVEHVVRGSPADRAGFHVDDRIVEVDGAAVTTSRDVVRVVGMHGSGDTVAVSVHRGGANQRLSVLLADFPSGDAILRMDHVGAPAPEWTDLAPTSGFPGSMAALRGHVVVVDFWATWCGPCREVAPVLSGWQARYGAQGLNVVGITTDPATAAASFKEQLGLRYPMASDPHGATSSLYGVSALPTLFVVDRHGVVREVTVGTGPDESARLEALVQALLAEPS